MIFTDRCSSHKIYAIEKKMKPPCVRSCSIENRSWALIPKQIKKSLLPQITANFIHVKSFSKWQTKESGCVRPYYYNLLVL